jgi:eukaryotic-like serine/threonine-protein kinase
MSERSIFLAMLEIEDPRARSAYLEEACAGDPALRTQVQQLLEAHQEPGRFMERPAPALITTADEPISERPGTVITPYKLLEQIGEGGFGVVFMSEQTQPMRRKVALKVLKPGMDTRQVVARFEAERQALALMDHPNIARVFDGGETGSGRPYFVMELVRGVPITDFCDQNHLPVRERLELFITVCQAVQHAHQKGIIHRDLKPSNVLVTLHDGTPVAKIIDFGIAKAMGQQLTDKTLFTSFAQMIGTPLYMSPEQAEMSGLDVDTRTDIYALGVLLYELLTGTTPFDRERLRTVSYDEIRRIICEEEPPKPSTRISTLGQAGVTVSANRESDPQVLSRLCRGELDWIVMKALEKDRNRRYESASAFAADVQRYLHDEPVLACPPSAWYRFRKFARRNKAVLLTASAVVLAVSLAAAVSTVLIWRANQNLQEALERELRDSYFHRIALAHRELSENNLRGALQLLSECPEKLRDWEWHYLQRLCRVDPVTLQGQGNGIRGVAFSPDGRMLAAANEDGTIGFFEVATGAPLPPLRGHTCKVRSVAFHPLGTRLASASADRTVKVWDLTTGKEVFSREGHPGTHAGASGVAFSPDGRLLAAGDKDDSVVIWDATNGQVIKRLAGHERMAVCVAFSPDSRLPVTGTWDGDLRIWDTQTWHLVRTERGDGQAMGAVVFSRDGRYLATTSYDRLVKLWDVATGDLLNSWRGHDCIIPGLAFSRDGRRLATIGGEDKTVKLSDPLTGREILKLRGHTYFGECVVFSPDGQRLASSRLEGKICIWDATPANAGQEQWTRNHDDEVWSVTFSPDGQRIASGGRDKAVRLWDATTGALLHSPLSHPRPVYLVAFSPHRDGKRLASVSRDKTVRIWDATTGEKLRAFTTPNDHLFGMTFSPDAQYLLVDDVGGNYPKEEGSHAVAVWDLNADRKEPKVIGIVGRHAEDIWCLKFSPDGKLLVSASNDEWVKLWRWDPARPGQPQEPLHSLRVRTYGYGDCVAFTPDSERLVTAGEEHTVKIWDVKAGKESCPPLRGHAGDVTAVAISPDARWLATAGEDTTIVLWDTQTWERRHTLRGHTGMVMSLAFSPDSRRLVSGSRDRMVKVWDMTRCDNAHDH